MHGNWEWHVDCLSTAWTILAVEQQEGDSSPWGVERPGSGSHHRKEPFLPRPLTTGGERGERDDEQRHAEHDPHDGVDSSLRLRTSRRARGPARERDEGRRQIRKSDRPAGARYPTESEARFGAERDDVLLGDHQHGRA